MRTRSLRSIPRFAPVPAFSLKRWDGSDCPQIELHLARTWAFTLTFPGGVTVSDNVTLRLRREEEIGEDNRRGGILVGTVQRYDANMRLAFAVLHPNRSIALAWVSPEWPPQRSVPHPTHYALNPPPGASSPLYGAMRRPRLAKVGSASRASAATVRSTAQSAGDAFRD